ncbi:MAG: cysteine--tRNA ligase [Candidatus Woykebacteria bacterium]
MVEVNLTNTLTRKKEKFVSVGKSEVRIYSCGPTVYRDIHIGNLRTYLSADILKRVLIYNGYKVRHIKNITDVGHMRTDGASQTQIDPVIAEALKQGKTPQEIAEGYTKQFFDDEKRLNILPADTFPKATEYIKEMVEITKALLEKGFAYETEGNIYFDVKKFTNYGRLSGNTVEKMAKLLEAVRVSSETDKKDSADFALWKKAEAGRTMKWASPWGEGFPGWHIECSAMSLKLLGEAFEDDRLISERARTIDIHTGGEDNIFPHHEDEIAQSESATGKKFVNFWLHGGFLLVEGKKMARREGNVYTVETLSQKDFNPLSFRYLCLTAHYRSRLNFTRASLESAENALNNLYREVTGYALESESKVGGAQYEDRFLEAINNDMDMPKALEVVWELVKSDNTASAKLESLYKFDAVLGLGLEKVAKEASKVPSGVTRLMEEREGVRKAGDFEKADQIRGQIEKAGYEVVDTKEGPKLKKLIDSR